MSEGRFRETEICRIPEGWEWKKLGDVAEIIMGQSPPGSSYNEIGKGMPFLQGKTEFSQISPVHMKYTTQPMKIAPVSSVLMSVRAPVGDVNISNRKYCIGRGLASISLRDGENKYLFHFLNHSKKMIEKKGTGSTFKAITKTTLEKLRIPLPPLPIQKKIVTILDKADRTRSLHKQVDGYLDQFLKSVFIEMFGDPVKNPKRWELKKLGEIGDVSSGVTLNSKRRNNSRNLFPYLRVGNVFRNKLDLKEIKYIHVTDSEFERYLLTKGDLLIVEGHGNIEEIGRTAVWNGEISNCLHQNHIIKTRLSDTQLSTHFISHYLNSYGNYGYFSSKSSTTSGLNTISTNKVRNAKIIIPPLHLQEKFAQIVENVDQLRQQHQQSSQETNNLFNALMQKAFRGELT